MKFIKFFLIVMLAVVPCTCWAQDDVLFATDKLGTVLSNLKQSVEQLTADNEQLTHRNNALKQETYQLQVQLGHLEQQEDLLNKRVVKLQDKNENRTEKIVRLEEENADLDKHIQKTQAATKLIQQQVQQGQGIQAQPSPESQITAHRQKEKLRLMKMIYDSQQNQLSLHKSILDYENQTPVLPAASALAHQQVLKEQIKDLEDQIAAFDDLQLHQLQVQIKTLEQNDAQLKSLLGAGMTDDQHIEQDQLERNRDDLNQQEAQLKANLENLRSQMIDLDKRKSDLETLVRQQP